jgi:hypothetical protein
MYSQRRFTIHLTFLCAVLLGAWSMAWAQSSDALAGKWKMLSVTPDGGDIAWTLSITESSGKYAATVASADGETPVKDFRVDGNKVHFRTPYQGEEYDIDLKLEGNRLTGTWSGNGDSGQTKGEKVGA